MVTFEKRLYAEGTYEALRSRIESLETQLKKAGLRVAGSSRLGNYRRALESAAMRPVAARDDAEYRLIHRAILECSQLLLIVQELSRAPEVSGWAEKVQEVLSGHDSPHTEGSQSRGRDTQFELYLAGLARRADYDVHLQEPDIVIEDTEGAIAIAAKRLKSQRKLRENLRSANRQIVESGTDGMAALDLGMLLVPQDQPLLAADFLSARAVYSSLLSEFIHPRAVNIRASVDWAHTYALVAVVTGLVIFADSDKFVALTQCRALNLCSEHDARCKRIETLVHRLGSIEID